MLGPTQNALTAACRLDCVEILLFSSKDRHWPGMRQLFIVQSLKKLFSSCKTRERVPEPARWKCVWRFVSPSLCLLVDRLLRFPVSFSMHCWWRLAPEEEGCYERGTFTRSREGSFLCNAQSRDPRPGFRWFGVLLVPHPGWRCL